MLTINESGNFWACHLVIMVKLTCQSDPKSYAGWDLTAPDRFNHAGLVKRERPYKGQSLIFQVGAWDKSLNPVKIQTITETPLTMTNEPCGVMRPKRVSKWYSHFQRRPGLA